MPLPERLCTNKGGAGTKVTVRPHERAGLSKVPDRARGGVGRGPVRQLLTANLDHDFNIGSIVRTANAMGACRVHVVGRKRWNRRGAMVTDRYLPVDHRPEVRELLEHCSKEGLTLVGVDNVEGSVALEGAVLPERACLVFGSEASGLSEEMIRACDIVVAITQRGSTRSMNVGHAAAIVMWAHASRLDAAEDS